MVTDIGKIDR